MSRWKEGWLSKRRDNVDSLGSSSRDASAVGGDKMVDASAELPGGDRDAAFRGSNRNYAGIWPKVLGAAVCCSVAVVWLLPRGNLRAPLPKDDPHVTREQRFDANVPHAVLAPPEEGNSIASPDPARAQPASGGPLPPTPLPPLPQEELSGRLATGTVAVAAATAGKTLTPLEMRQQSKTLLVGSATGNLSSTAPASNAGLEIDGRGSQSPAGSEAALGRHLEPTILKASRAEQLANRTFTVTEGTFIDCVLETALSSDVPGLTSCLLTRDVYGDDAKVVLLERGTQLVGEYRGGIQQGKSRLFVLWTRAKTPEGVLVELDSPTTDALGRSGMDGFVDTHFWQRFGAALFLSSVDDSLALLVAKAQQSSTSGSGPVILPQNTTNAAQGAAAIAVANDVQIQPTLVKNQGEHINVFVARDLDFKGVYALETTGVR